MPTIPADVAERAAKRARPDGSGCFISTYSIGSHGYAQIGWQRGGERTMTTAHRAAWVHHRGPIPADLTVDHICHTRQCVNPAHLRLLTNPENASDNGQVRTNREVGRLCHKGHPLVASGKGRTYCRDCLNARRRARRVRAF